MDNINDISFPNLGITLSNVPCGFTVFGKEIKLYAIIIGTAFLIAMFLAYNEAKKTKQNPELYVDAFLVTMIPAIIGARLYYVIFEWDSYKNNIKSIFYIWNGGLAIYGGIIAGMLTLFAFSKVRKCSYGLILDTLVPGLVLGQAFGRWGNFFNREAFGGNTNSLFAMRIPTDHIYTSYSSSVRVYENEAVPFVQVHPTFLYESILCFCIFVLLILVRRKKKNDGEVFLLYVILYGVGRFWIESLRTDQLIIGKIGSVNVPVSQCVALVSVLISVVLIAKGRYNSTKKMYLSDK